MPCSDWWLYKTREAQIGKQRSKLRTVAFNHNLWMLRNYIKRCNEIALFNHLANGERKHPALFIYFWDHKDCTCRVASSLSIYFCTKWLSTPCHIHICTHVPYIKTCRWTNSIKLTFSIYILVNIYWPFILWPQNPHIKLMEVR